MKYVKHVRGKWVVRITVPEELRAIVGKRELVETDLPSDTRKRERLAHGIINRFLSQIDEAREALEAEKDAPARSLSVAAKAYYKTILETDGAKRNTLPTKTQIDAEHDRLMQQIDVGEFGISHGETAYINATTDYELMLGARAFYSKNRYTMRFPGLTLPQAIKANEKLPEPFDTLAPQTINMKWLSHLSSILQWASNNGHIDSNPAQGIRVDTGSKVHREASRDPFTRDELQLIFGDPMFANPSTYGLNQWALLVMLYTGVRNSSEMASMKLSNIYEEQGIPVSARSRSLAGPRCP